MSAPSSTSPSPRSKMGCSYKWHLQDVNAPITLDARLGLLNLSCFTCAQAVITHEVTRQVQSPSGKGNDLCDPRRQQWPTEATAARILRKEVMREACDSRWCIARTGLHWIEISPCFYWNCMAFALACQADFCALARSFRVRAD